MKQSEFEKLLVSKGLVPMRTQAQAVSNTIKHAASVRSAVAMLKRHGFSNAEELVSASANYDAWATKRMVNWDGTVEKVSPPVASEGNDPFEVAAALSRSLTHIKVAAVDIQMQAMKRSVSVQKGMIVHAFSMAGMGAVYKFAPSDIGVLKGYASTPALDSSRHVVVNGAFSAAIRERGLTGPKGIKLLLDHDHSKPAGAITKLAYDGTGLAIEAHLALDIPYVSDRYAAIKAVGGMSFSVGFFLQEYEWKEDASKREYLQINKGELFEVSVVTFPANEQAQML